MKKVGSMEISFRNFDRGVYYYDLSVTIGTQKRNVRLPRYHTFLGWVEAFGLPPQNEWVVLKDLADFTKTGNLVIDDVPIEETITYTSSQKPVHQVVTKRVSDTTNEQHIWTQNYERAPDAIENQIVFTHDQGTYEANWLTEIMATVDRFSPEEQSFAKEHIAERAQHPDVLIKKTFTAKGALPPVYYQLFPITELVDLTNCSGSVIEMGYLNRKSTFEVDHVHGDWCKQFVIGDKKLWVFESNYTSCDHKVDGKTERIKNTYLKELFID